MNIGIIGAGNIGSVLARKLVKAGQSIRIANSRGPDTMKELARQTGAKPVTTAEAIRGLDFVSGSMPLGKLPLLRALLAGLPGEVVVADTSHYCPLRDGQIAAIDGDEVESLWVSEQIGHPVIKAWNNILAASLADKGQA